MIFRIQRFEENLRILKIFFVKKLFTRQNICSYATLSNMLPRQAVILAKCYLGKLLPWQYVTRQNVTRQNRTRQNVTRQNVTRQNVTRQIVTRQNLAEP